MFLPLQQALQNGPSGEGNIFYVTAGASLLAFIGIWLSYRLFNRAQIEASLD